ncbi:MAG: hypothetical protein GF330_01455, partial [Candidatus Eisenbacteria bacterium]|nr:hypothetical protein [Candidatus Eisenbacteria bacterium]
MRARTLCSVLAVLALSTGVVSAQEFTFPIINEILYDGDGADTGMFTEIGAPAGMSMDGFALVGINGSNGEEYRTVYLDGMVVPDDGYLVIAQDETCPDYDYIDSGMDWQNGADEVELRLYFGDDYDLYDAICYGFSENLDCEGGTNGPDTASGLSISRCPDGQDTDDNEADTAETTPTPGVENDCGVEPPTEYDLCEAVMTDDNGFPVHFEEFVHITSPLIVLNDDGTYDPGRLEAAATDGECCVYLFDFDYNPGLMAGDEIDVTGTIDFYNGKLEISSPGLEIVVLSSGNPLPEPELITTEELATNGEDYESCLIQCCGLTILGGDPWPV